MAAAYDVVPIDTLNGERLYFCKNPKAYNAKQNELKEDRKKKGLEPVSFGEFSNKIAIPSGVIPAYGEVRYNRDTKKIVVRKGGEDIIVDPELDRGTVKFLDKREGVTITEYGSLDSLVA